ncbi:MAG: hypothetical protein SGBAC_005098 [Bacillariaceae sp.]
MVKVADEIFKNRTTRPNKKTKKKTVSSNKQVKVDDGDSDPTLPEEDSISSSQALPRRKMAPQHQGIMPEDDPLRWSLPPDEKISKEQKETQRSENSPEDDNDSDADSDMYLSEHEEDNPKKKKKKKKKAIDSRSRSKSPKRRAKSPKKARSKSPPKIKTKNSEQSEQQPGLGVPKPPKRGRSKSPKAKKGKKVERPPVGLPLDETDNEKKPSFPSPSSRMEELNRIKAKVKARKAKRKKAAEAKQLLKHGVSSFAEMDKQSERNKMKPKKTKAVTNTKTTSASKLGSNYLKGKFLSTVKKLETVTRMSGSGSARSRSIRDENVEMKEVVAAHESDSDSSHQVATDTDTPKKNFKLTAPHSPKSVEGLSPNPAAPDAKKLKADAISKIRAFAIFRNRIEEQKEFLDAFNSAVDESDEEDEADRETNAATLAERRKKKQDTLDRLLTQLQEYEAKLEQDRKEMSDENVEYQLKQESAEQLLQEETRKNEELQLQLQLLQGELDQACEAAIVEELNEKNILLETKVELLQQKNDRFQETISSMMIAEKSEMKRQLSTGNVHSRRNSCSYLQSPGVNRRQFRLPKGPSETGSTRDSSYLSTPSTFRRKFCPPLANEGSMMLKGDDEDDDDDQSYELESGDDGDDAETVQSGYISMSAMSSKAQGELLQLRSTLQRQNTALEEQAAELKDVKLELETLRETQGVSNLQKHVKNLENEKHFFVSEIDKQKKELDAVRKELEAATAAAESSTMADDSIASPTSERSASSRGWFRFGGGNGTTKTENIAKAFEKNSTDDIINDLNGTNTIFDLVDDFVPQPKLDQEPNDEPVRRLESLLAF